MMYRSPLWSATSFLLLGVTAVGFASTDPTAPDPAQAPEVMIIGLTESAFFGANRNDMEAALKILGQNAARSMGHPLKMEVRCYTDPASFGAAVRRGEVRLAVADSWTYLGMGIEQLDLLRYVSMTGTNAGKRYLLVTRRDNGLHSLADLHGKDLLLCEIVNSSLGRPWLNTLLLNGRFDSAETYFHSTRVVGKPMAAILPVFFRQADVCLVAEDALTTMTELNPQVGRELQVVVASEPLVDSIQIYSPTGWPNGGQLRTAMAEAIGRLHLDPAGHQILTLLKTDRLAPLQEKDLEPVRRLRKQYDELTRRVPEAPRAPAVSTTSP